MKTEDIRQAASVLGKLSASKRRLNPELYHKQQSEAAKKLKGKPRKRKPKAPSPEAPDVVS